MTVIAIDNAPENIRGKLTRWFLELKPGVFVGNINVRIRELLWERICKADLMTGAVMVFSFPNEQGFKMQVYGDPKRKVEDFEGVQLITVCSEEEIDFKESERSVFEKVNTLLLPNEFNG